MYLEKLIRAEILKHLSLLRRTEAIKTYVMNFAIHGFEDSYSRDGKVLVEEGIN